MQWLMEQGRHKAVRISAAESAMENAIALKGGRIERYELASNGREARRRGRGWPRGRVHQQLHEVEMGVHVMPATAAGQAGQDRCGSPATRVADITGHRCPFSWRLG
jgi:hypothetical protein